MSPIHVEPEDLYLTARRTWQTSFQMQEAVFALLVVAIRLEVSWQGTNADGYIYELRDLVRRLQRQVEALDQLGYTLSRQSNLWLEVDQTGAHSFTHIHFPDNSSV